MGKFFYEKNQCFVSCCSYIGRVGCGKQGLSIGRQCVDKETILHELGHALGYFHEQSRPDRDQYIRVLTKNINPSQSKSLFNK